jgi:pyruvate formate lyase activating enzyme
MIRDLKCSGCGACAAVCPEKAIRLEEEGKRQIDWQRCNQCFACVDACLYGALTVVGEHMVPDEVVAEVARDRIFYENSGGGVTFSGGEPLWQAEFLQEVMELLKQDGFHITLDTTGFASPAALERILPLVDLVLLDIKHLDAAQHAKLTGVDNRIILDNARIITDRVQTWFRMPLMAGLNDDADHVSRVTALALDLGVKKISFLPYHDGGISKWPQIGKMCPDFAGREPEEDHLAVLTQLVSSSGIQVGIRS